VICTGIEAEIAEIIERFIAGPIPRRVEEAILRGYCRIIIAEESGDPDSVST
jgi:hypothetical protein